MNKLVALYLAAIVALPVFAEPAEEQLSSDAVTTDAKEEFISEERTEEGFLTHYLNNAIASGMKKVDENEKVQYGRKITDYVSAPKFGGYFIGKYAYSSREGDDSGDGFTQRMTRLYIDGTILKDFAYRVQMQVNNSTFHMKDYFIEWRRFPELKVKIGQFKRAFGLENPMNPWDVGTGDYSQLTKKLSGYTDFIGVEASNNGGRDQGIQLQGDLFPIGKDKHRFVHYQIMVSNGQGINTKDANSRKDVSGTLQFQPIKGLIVGMYGWTGNFTYEGVTVSRNRYDIVASYDKNDWTVRAEYAHSTGSKIKSKDLFVNHLVMHNGTVAGTYGEMKKQYYAGGSDRADAWYITMGIPCTSWLKTYLKYDVYRDDATWGTTRSIYSIAPNIQLHKNLMFQPQFNYVHDRSAASGKRNFCELWVESYVRF